MTEFQSFGGVQRGHANGIGFLIACQAMINIAVVTNSMINKGMPLPFVSLGGSSAVSMLVMVGLLLSIARRAPENSQASHRGSPNPFHSQIGRAHV